MKAKIVPAALALGLAACSGAPFASSDSSPTPLTAQPPTSAVPTQPRDNTGSVGIELTLAGGGDISAVSWVIAGPNDAATVVQSDIVDVHASAAPAFLVTGLAPASGYTVVLSAVSRDAGISCEGSATFAITARATARIVVHMACTTARAGGHVTLVNGTSYDCAAWNTVTASPLETTVGHSVSLAATATGPVPANITYQWSASSGQIADPTAASTRFTCTVTGTASVTLTVGDGAVPEGGTCNQALDTDTITVTCTAP